MISIAIFMSNQKNSVMTGELEKLQSKYYSRVAVKKKEEINNDFYRKENNNN